MKLETGIRRSSWKQAWTLAAALALVMGMLASGSASAASKEKVVIYHAGSIDSLHPYNHSLSPAYGIWEHIMEPLVQVDQKSNRYVRSSPSPGSSRARSGSSS